MYEHMFLEILPLDLADMSFRYQCMILHWVQGSLKRLHNASCTTYNLQGLSSSSWKIYLTVRRTFWTWLCVCLCSYWSSGRQVLAPWLLVLGLVMLRKVARLVILYTLTPHIHIQAHTYLCVCKHTLEHTHTGSALFSSCSCLKFYFLKKFFKNFSKSISNLPT